MKYWPYVSNFIWLFLLHFLLYLIDILGNGDYSTIIGFSYATVNIIIILSQTLTSNILLHNINQETRPFYEDLFIKNNDIQDKDLLKYLVKNNSLFQPAHPLLTDFYIIKILLEIQAGNYRYVENNYKKIVSKYEESIPYNISFIEFIIFLRNNDVELLLNAANRLLQYEENKYKKVLSYEARLRQFIVEKKQEQPSIQKRPTTFKEQDSLLVGENFRKNKPYIDFKSECGLMITDVNISTIGRFRKELYSYIAHLTKNESRKIIYIVIDIWTMRINNNILKDLFGLNEIANIHYQVSDIYIMNGQMATLKDSENYVNSIRSDHVRKIHLEHFTEEVRKSGIDTKLYFKIAGNNSIIKFGTEQFIAHSIAEKI